jgi:hypothetical protein
MTLVLLLTITTTGFVSNGYQKAYAAAELPTSDIGTKIREWTNNLIMNVLIAWNMHCLELLGI